MVNRSYSFVRTNLAVETAEARLALATTLAVLSSATLPVHLAAAVTAVLARVWVALSHHFVVVFLCQES